MVYFKVSYSNFLDSAKMLVNQIGETWGTKTYNFNENIIGPQKCEMICGAL